MPSTASASVDNRMVGMDVRWDSRFSDSEDATPLSKRTDTPQNKRRPLSSTPRLSPARTLVAGSRFGSKPGHQTLAITYQNMGTPIKTWANYQNLGKLSKPGNFEIIKTWASKIKIK